MTRGGPGLRRRFAFAMFGAALAGCSGAQTPVRTLQYEGALGDGDDDGRVLERSPVMRGPVARGIALPYPLDRVFGTFGDCRDGGRRQHNGLDLGGVGPHAGLGTPMRSMTRARITFIGTPETDPAQFGRPDRQAGNTERGGQMLPRNLDVPGYGRVDFFTLDYGSWRSGVVIVTEGIGEPLDGHQIRYMHLGAVHPELRVGDEVEAGQEIGLMGGTAVQQDSPHVHIDIETPEGVRIDVAPLLGMEPDRSRCR